MCTHYCLSKHLFTPDYATCMTATETLRLNKMREIYNQCLFFLTEHKLS